MTQADPELARLLVEELRRHLPALEASPRDGAAAQRAVHALKGSAGLAGERELAASLERLHRRVRDGDSSAFDEAANVVRTAIQHMSAGQPPVAAQWPEPPADILAHPLDPLVRAQYAAEVTDRLARLDEALASSDKVEAAAVAYRQLHTMKGAASAVGDDAMSWFCHGLEERLKAAKDPEAAAKALAEVVRYRSVLGALLDDPEGALRTLRRHTSVPPSRLSNRPEEEAPRSFAPGADDLTVRVPAASIDRLIDRLESFDLVRDRLGIRADAARDIARTLKRLRVALVEALRLIGPPRPWGAPAAALHRIERVSQALGPIGDEIDGAAGGLRGAGLSIRDGVTEAKRHLSSMRQTPLGRVFARLANAAETEARRIDRAVIVRTKGADETIDRRVAEQLVEPCIQLVRNAVAHGIEPADARVASGKAPSGTISLLAKKASHRLSITIQDDGAGVDVAEVRKRAVEAGTVSREVADAADDDTLLTLLFLPGFSTRDSTDLLAGRGIGLDIARVAIQRMGGTILLSSKKSEGFSARIDVPIGSGLATVLWVLAGGEEYALPVTTPVRVGANDGVEAGRVPHLSACLEARTNERGAHAITFELDEESAPITIGVDAIGRIEEVLMRPLTPLVAGLGPFAAAIARADGSLRLALDVHAIAPRARALARGIEGRRSDAPPSSGTSQRSGAA